MSEQHSTPNPPEVFQSAQPDRDVEPQRPADTLRDGRLKATIWRNEGESGSFYTTHLAKTYEDRNGNLRDGQSFTKSDLPKLGILANQAYTRIGEMQREHIQSHAPVQSRASEQHGLQNAQHSSQQNAQPPREFAESRAAPTRPQGQGQTR